MLTDRAAIVKIRMLEQLLKEAQEYGDISEISAILRQLLAYVKQFEKKL